MIDTVQLWFLLGGLAAGALLGGLLNQLRLSARLQAETAAQQQELSKVQNQLEQATIRLAEATEQVARQEQKIIELTQRCNKGELELATATEQLEQKKQLQTRLEQQEQRLLDLQDNQAPTFWRTYRMTHLKHRLVWFRVFYTDQYLPQLATDNDRQRPTKASMENLRYHISGLLMHVLPND